MAFIFNPASTASERYSFEKYVELITTSGLDAATVVYDIQTSWFLAQVLKLPNSGQLIIDGSNEQRPDLISLDAHGDDQYWALIMYYNNISDFTTLLTGTILNTFSINGLENLYFRLKGVASSDVPQTVRN
ncbi:hypothetical protein GR11A_00118 [Vibrio phage vB_VcorM_GR11A]|nr:hypothetical protein GR11A_00118 [Vibrio phage vB_VcorM_GR11A]